MSAIHTEGRHPSVVSVAEFFDYQHLAAGLVRDTSASCAGVADAMVARLPDDPELAVGLRKLLEAKDCFVRVAVRASKPVARTELHAVHSDYTEEKMGELTAVEIRKMAMEFANKIHDEPGVLSTRTPQTFFYRMPNGDTRIEFEVLAVMEPGA